MGPCGDEGTAPTTGVVTPFSPGDTVTITLDETIFHPGHYRVALALNDRSELPAEPPVTPGATPCGSVPIESTPVLPVLVDGALEHTEPFSGMRFIQVTLPPDVTCTHCTLQVLEFMSDHSSPCFYHHCADISISAPTQVGCSGDGDCADDNVCTSDRCNPATHACEHLDTVTCDDGDACTRDACSTTQGCISQPIALPDVDTGVLGALQAVPCAAAQVPPRIAALFEKAHTSLARAARTPVKADVLLRRASRRLHRATARLAKVGGRGISTDCATALSTALGQAQARVQCLLRSP
jgi:hypothetical protein